MTGVAPRSNDRPTGWSLRVGSPEGYTSIRDVPGANAELADRVVELMRSVSDGDDAAAPDPDLVSHLVRHPPGPS